MRDVGRRRSWSWAEKWQMVTERAVAGASVSIVARRHDINANLLFKWRKEIEAEDRAGGVGKASEFLPIGIVGPAADGGPALLPRIGSSSEHRTSARSGDLADCPGLMEIEFAGGVTVRANASVDERALGRLLAALKRYQ